MIESPPSRMIALAAGLAILMHLLFFAVVRPAVAPPAGWAVAPATRYLGSDRANDPFSSAAIRTVWSPVVFSLPSAMGFSGELYRQDVATRLAFKQQAQPERFLQAPVAPGGGPGGLALDSLMLTAGGRQAPQVPGDLSPPPARRPSARRVTISPEFMDRLVGGVVLPPELNKEVAAPWEVRATLNVSERGVVRHVLLDRPLEFPVLNQPVLQLLYGLRFKPGPAMDGTIEIYSPEPGVNGGTAP